MSINVTERGKAATIKGKLESIMKCFGLSFIFCLSHRPVTSPHICSPTLGWLFAVFHREPPPRGPKCSRFIKCHEGNTHTPCAPWIFVNRTVNCVYKNVCPRVHVVTSYSYSMHKRLSPIHVHPQPPFTKTFTHKNQRAGNTAPAVLVLSFDTSHCQKGKRQMFRSADCWALHYAYAAWRLLGNASAHLWLMHLGPSRAGPFVVTSQMSFIRWLSLNGLLV